MLKTIYVSHQFYNVVDPRLEEHYKVISRDYYIHFLEEFRTKVVNLRNSDKFNGYVNFPITKLRKIYGYKKIQGKRQYVGEVILRNLMSSNIIERTNNYSMLKKKAYGYKISNDVYTEMAINDINSDTRSIESTLYKSLVNTPKDDIRKKDNATLAFLKSKRFDIDLNAALNWISQNYIKNVEEDSSLDNQEKQKELYDLYSLMSMNIKNNKVFAFYGNESPRVYTTFNTIKRELRAFCTIDGEKLISSDLKTSQPFLFASSLIKEFFIEDANNFYNDVTSGDIYTIFLNQWKEKGITVQEYTKKGMKDIPLVTRDDAKPEFLRFIFKSSNKGVRRPFDIIFEERYPELYQLIKSGEGRALKLQKEEAALFLPVANKHLELGCLSVHDSLYFKAKDQEVIIKDLKKQFDDKGLTGYELDPK